MIDDIGKIAAGAHLTVNLGALVANYQMLKSASAPASCAAVVKADAYGLGAARIAPCLERAGCSDFFVAHLVEALELKPALRPTSRLYVLNGLQPGAESACADAGVIPVINGIEQAWRWRALAASQGVALPAVLQVDSGMARLGLSPNEVALLGADDTFFTHVPLALVMSHLACADEPSRSSNDDQRQRFIELAAALPAAARSLANSGGVFLGDAYHADLVRLGISLYGGAPNDAPNPMRAVVSLNARVIQVRDIAPGAGVGYGLTYARNTPGRIATIAVGYADGWPRRLGNVGAAYYQGIRLPIAGRVSMDSITLDITELAQQDLVLNLGDDVELIGPHQTLQDVAAAAETIPYEILTSLGRRYHRTYREAAEMTDVQSQQRDVDAQQ